MEELRKGYKQTDIGIIPGDWEVKKLGKLGEVRMCKRIFKEQTSVSGSIPFYKIGTFGYEADAFISKELYEQYKQQYFFPKKGDILFSAAGTIGKTIIYDGRPCYFQDSNIVWIENDERSVINKYLFYFYKVVQWATSEGGIVSRLYNENIRNTSILLPPTLSEQQAIAEVLSDIDSLIEALDKKIAKKRAIKEGAMQQLLTGKKRLAGFTEPWIEKKLGEIAEIFKGQGLSKSKTSNNGKRFCILYGELFTAYTVKITQIISRTDLEEGVCSKMGDVLLPGSTTTIGIDLARASALLLDNILLGGDINVIRTKDNSYNSVLLAYIITYCKKQDIALRAKGITVYHLHGKDLIDLNVYLPKYIEEQDAIAQILTDMDDEIEQLEKKRQKYTALKQGAMQKLLTGQIRLIAVSQTQLAEKPQKQANVYFKRSVWAAEIADRLCDELTFGHVKMEKIIFLTEHICGVNIGSNYHRDVAGPYDSRAIRSIDSQLKKQKWFEVVRRDMGYCYIPLSKRGGHKNYFNKYYSDVAPLFDKVINTFRTWNTERCEIVATLYSAWKDLESAKQQYTDNDIINEVLNNWNESKKRIPETRWQKALNWMRENGFAPIKT